MNLNQDIIIGEGSHATVIKSMRDNIFVAIKNINIDEGYGVPSIGDMDIPKHYDHPNILKVLSMDYAIDLTSVEVVMELAIIDLFAYYESSQEVVDENQRAYFSWCLLSGYKALQDCGIYHCDIKASNCLLFRNNTTDPAERYLLKLADFGLSVHMYNADNACQTISNAPPELWRVLYEENLGPDYEQYMNQDIDHDKIVAFGIGVLLYYILTSISLLGDNNHYPAISKMTYLIDNLDEILLKVNESWRQGLKLFMSPSIESRQFYVDIFLKPLALYGYNNFVSGLFFVVRPRITNTLNNNEYNTNAKWMMKCMHTLSLYAIVPFSTIDLYHRVIDTLGNNDPSKYQLVSVACMGLMISFHGRNIALAYYAYITDNAYSEIDILNTQLDILKVTQGMVNSYSNLYDTCTDVEDLKRLARVIIDLDLYRTEITVNKPVLFGGYLRKKRALFSNITVDMLIDQKELG